MKQKTFMKYMFQKMEDTIRKDVVDVDQRIFELASRLSSERANVIRNEVL